MSNTAPSNNGPLSGVRILEIGHMLAGPYCAMLLADLGADVIKIEADDGDFAREINAAKANGHSVYFASLNRNKRSVLLDLKSTEGQNRLATLVKGADGLVTNLRPGAIKRLGLTFENLKRHNPKIACLALTGFGLETASADKPAYDYVIQGLCGVMKMTGNPGDGPVRAGYSAVDNSAGIMGALALVACIHGGQGGQVDVSLYGTMLSQLNYVAAQSLATGKPTKRFKGGAHPMIVPAQIFETLDSYLTLFISHDGFWQKFCHVAEREAWLSDPNFATKQARSTHRKEVLLAIEAVIRTRMTKDWITQLSQEGVVASEILSLEEALASPLSAQMGMITTLEDDTSAIQVVASPIKVAGFVPRYCISPRLGEHTDEILEGVGL